MRLEKIKAQKPELFEGRVLWVEVLHLLDSYTFKVSFAYMHVLASPFFPPY